jgi:hypothetical protein
LRHLLAISFATALLCGCAASAPTEAGRDSLIEGLQVWIAFAGASAAYRDETGRWPCRASDLAGTPGAPVPDRLAWIDEGMQLKSDEHGLLVIHDQYGAVFRVAIDGQLTPAEAAGRHGGAR